MGEAREGLSLQGLAERMEALERENAELRGKVAALERPEASRGDLAPRKTPEETGRENARRSSGSEEAVSRRAMLTKAGAAAVAAVAAGTLLSPREAKAATVEGSGTPGVHGVGTANGSSGVRAELGSGVTDGHGVIGYGRGSGYYGTYGENNSSGGYGVSGLGDTGVYGVSISTDGYGVVGEGDTGVYGHTNHDTYSGVYGLHEGTTGYGVFGGGTGSGAGVLGRNPSGAGVEGNHSRYGGKFDGSGAPLLLVPKGTTGRPTSGAHSKGEIYLDSAASIFVCTKGGTPGTWRKVTTTSA